MNEEQSMCEYESDVVSDWVSKGMVECMNAVEERCSRHVKKSNRVECIEERCVEKRHIYICM